MSSCWIKQPTQWEKTFAHCTKKKQRLISKIYKKLQKFNNTKANNAVKKSVKEVSTFQKKESEWLAHEKMLRIPTY